MSTRTGVSATVGGNLIGDAALCAAYASAAVPTCRFRRNQDQTELAIK